jgi:hypothetical protein
MDTLQRALASPMKVCAVLCVVIQTATAEVRLLVVQFVVRQTRNLN